MEIIKTGGEEKTIFKLSGRLDMISSQVLQNTITPEFEKSKHIELDFSDLAYVSSAGLRVLLMGQKTAKLKRVKFLLSNVSEEIMEVFEMTGFSSILEIK